jgi:CBS domain-containing protein
MRIAASSAPILQETTMTQVSDVMTRGVRSMQPQDMVELAAQAMDELNVGTIPVCEGERLVGIVTDRDIVVRAVAQGLAADRTPLGDVMSTQVHTCREDDALEEVAELMSAAQVRRLPVLDRDERLIGILSLGDIAAKAGSQEAGDALSDISEPAAPDRSGQSIAAGAAGGGAPQA